MFRYLLMSILGCLAAAAQTTKVDLQNQARGVDFSAASYTKPAKTGTALPAACSTGEAFVLTSAVPGLNLFICTATNTWTLQGGTHGTATAGGVGFSTEQAAGDAVRTAFDLAGAPLDGSLTVAVNGQIQEAGTLADYTLAGSRVTFTSAAVPPSGARISFRYAVPDGSSVTPAVGFETEQSNGTGSQAAFALSAVPLDGSLTVAVNGQIQEAGAQADYTLAGSAVTFNAASIPASGARVSFRYGTATGSLAMMGQASMAAAGDGAFGFEVPAAAGVAAGGTQVFTTPGVTSWTVPAGVTRVFAEVWGAGAGGGVGFRRGGEGGAGGGFADRWCAVTPASVVTVIVGAGGAPASSGGDSSFGTCAAATGGASRQHKMQPGKAAGMPDGLYFRAGGQVRSGVGASVNAAAYLPARSDLGGIGGGSSSLDRPASAGGGSLSSGGGGGSGARSQTGGTHAGGAGGKSARGGTGGQGGGVAGPVNTPCTAGDAPGGGGGGGAGNGIRVSAGCEGARGQVIIWW